MTYLRKRLTSHEISTHLARAKAMRAAGVEIEIPEEWLDHQALIIRASDTQTNLVFDSPAGCAAYAMWVQLVARESTTLLDCQITSQLDNEIVLASFPGQDQFCKLGPMEFPKRQLLNSRLENGLSIRRGQVIEGTILGWGRQPIPAACWDGIQVPCTLAFRDQYGEEISHQTAVCCDRTWKTKKVVRPSDGGLYGGSPQPQNENICETTRLRYLAMTNPDLARAEKAKKKPVLQPLQSTEEIEWS